MPRSEPLSAGPPKKMNSLSSLQSSLKFPSLPPRKAHTALVEDQTRMPPPPPGVTGKGGFPSSKASQSVRGVDLVPKGVSPETERKRTSAPDSVATPQGIWADVYAPTAEADLAPGKPRLAKVKTWLSEAVYGHPFGYVAPPGGLSDLHRDKLRRYRRLLMLSGPAGIGKTTALRVIADEMGIDLVEWGEGIEEFTLGGGIERESAMSKFASFLSRHTFSPLPMSSQSPMKASRRPRILLLTSLPNISHLPTRDAFHATLASFCKSYTPGAAPLVIVYSEGGSSGRAEESWMDRERSSLRSAQDIVGKEVTGGAHYTEIDFLPLAPTFMQKALNRVLDVAAYNHTMRPPTSAVQLIALTSNGDLRSAINSLQLVCSTRSSGSAAKRKRTETANQSPRRGGKGSRGGKGAKIDLSDDLRAVLDAVSRREQSLGLFHALGKIMYNKRLQDPEIGKEDAELVAAIKALPAEDPLPAHLKDFHRERSLVRMDTFLPSIPIDASSFALWLHQNLPAFCQDIEGFSRAVDDFCCADLMKTDDDVWQSSPQAIAYSLHLSVRASLLGLPSPVPRNKDTNLCKPEFFDNIRIAKNNVDHLDVAAAYLARRSISASIHLSEQPFDQFTQGAWGGLSSKKTLATELIPMMTKMQGMTSTALLPASVRPLSMPLYTESRVQARAMDNRDSGDDTSELPEAMSEIPGVVSKGGWDDAGLEVDDEDAGLEEDIEDWDDSD